MFKVFKESIEWGGRTLTLETGKVARQADGAVLATYGDTVVLCAVTAAKKAKPDIDFFPLTVNYQERYYAGGRIPGGFFKREGKPPLKKLDDLPKDYKEPDPYLDETVNIAVDLAKIEKASPAEQPAASK